MTDDLERPAADPPTEEPRAEAPPAEDPSTEDPPAEDAEPAAIATAVDPTDETADATDETADLLALIDRLSGLLERSDLTELEIEAGGTGLVLRKPAALASTLVMAAAPAGTVDPSGQAPAGTPGEPSAAGRQGPVVPSTPSVKAPLTGLWYASPAPGSPPYVQVGGEVAIGQTIGLIEAMKLFNEIKSDLAGRVVRVVAESGTLVKAKQALVEVEPL